MQRILKDHKVEVPAPKQAEPHLIAFLVQINLNCSYSPSVPVRLLTHGSLSQHPHCQKAFPPL